VDCWEKLLLLFGVLITRTAAAQDFAETIKHSAAAATQHSANLSARNRLPSLVGNHI